MSDTPDNVSPLGIPLSEQDIADITSMNEGGQPSFPEPEVFHPILRIWREVLEPAAEEAKKVVTPQWAARTCAQYMQLTFADMNAFRDRYYDKIEQLRQVLLAEIASDDECLNTTSPEEDKEQNSQHYKALLSDWQKIFLQWELDWRCTDDDAAVELAAVSEVHKMFFSQEGICAYLDNIQLEYTEADQQALAVELEAMKAEAQ